MPPRHGAILGLGLLVVAFVAVGVGFVRAAPGEADLLHSLSDEAMYYALAQRAADPTLFPGDPWIEKGLAVFPRPYLVVLEPFVLRDTRPARISFGFSLAAAAIFLLGAVLFARAATGRLAAGAVLVLLLAVPWFRDYGVAPGEGLARDLFFAAVPWLLLAFLRIRRGPGWSAALLGLGFGLLTNLHPLSGVHFAALFGVLALADRPGRAGIRTAALLAIGFLAGSAPFIASWLSYPRSGVPSAEAMLARASGVVAKSPERTAETWAPPLLLAAAVFAGGLAGLRERRVLVTASIAAGGLGLLGLLAGGLSYSLAQFQFIRLHRVFGFLALLGVAAALTEVAASRRPRSVAWGIVTLALLALMPVEIKVARRAAVRLFGHADVGVALTPRRPRAGEPSRWPEVDRRAYLTLARWIRDETPRDAKLLVPPESYGIFRVHARRSIVVTRKEGSYAVTFLGEEGERWMDLYRRVWELYRDSDTEEILAFAREHGVDYVLAEAKFNRLDLPVAFRAGPLVLYRVP